MMSDSGTKTKAAAQRIERNRAKPIQRYRFIVQVAFALLCIWIGIEFHYFVKGLEAGNVAHLPTRPPGVEGFLPISSLMSLYYFFLTGLVHPVHPAGLFILVAIILLSIAFGKSFCSWLCPVGFINELLGSIHDKIFKKKVFLPRWLDWPLRSLKYLLLLFFVWAIFVKMSALALDAFLSGPYNVMADVKMYYFFADITKLALIILVALFLLSILIRNFWCRFLCPYGALLGLTSLFSPTKIKRDPIKCIDCGKCAKACPSNIKVDKVLTVISDECHSCMNCIDVCPIADTLDLKLVGTKRKVDKRLVAVGVVGLFLLVTGLGIASGNWRNGITPAQYIHLQKDVQMMGHPTGSRDIEQLNREAEKRIPADASPSH